MKSKGWNPVSMYDHDYMKLCSFEDAPKLKMYLNHNQKQLPKASVSKLTNDTADKVSESYYGNNDLALLVRKLYVNRDPFADIPQCENILKVSRPEDEIKLMLQDRNKFDHRNSELKSEARRGFEITELVDFKGKIPVILDPRYFRLHSTSK